MSKGDQAIEAVGGYIVDVVGIQTSRTKKKQEKTDFKKRTVALHNGYQKLSP